MRIKNILTLVVFTLFVAGCEEEYKPITQQSMSSYSTMDSLQGLWFAQNDSLYRIKIEDHKWREMIGSAEIAALDFDITDSCQSQNRPKVGRYLVSLDTTTASNCSKIEYLRDSTFAVTTNNKIVFFKR